MILNKLRKKQINVMDLEFFKKIVNDIKEQDKRIYDLSQILKTDIVEFGDEIITDLINVVQKSMKNGYDLLNWWLYEFSEKDENYKFVYEEINDKSTIIYNLNKIEDLYYYMNGDFHKVKQKLVDTKSLDIRKTQILNSKDAKELFENLGVFEDE